MLNFLLLILFTSGWIQNSDAVVNFFTPDELRYTFGVTRHDEVPTYEEVFPELVYAGDNRTLAAIKVQISGRAYELSLEPTLERLLSPQATIVHRNDLRGGKLSVGAAQAQNCHYHHLSNRTMAAISTCDGRVTGTIMDKNGIHVIHPFPERHAHRAKRDVENTDGGVHVVFKRESLAPDADDFCGLDNEITEDDLIADDNAIFEDVFVTGQQLSAISDLVVELAVFVDETLWRHFSSKYGWQAQSKLQDYTLTLLNNIQIMYYQPTASPPLTFRVIRYEVLQSQPSSIAGGQHQHGHAQMYLDKFCRYQKNLAVRDWDHAIMLTGYDIHRGYGSRSISGIARLDGMCDPFNTCTLAEGLDFTSAFIGTHELGHSVGMRHDEPYCQSKHIMSSSLGPGKVTWSTCSLRDYHQFLQRLDARGKNCLRQTTMPLRMSIPTNSKPGQIYDANLQCELMHGVGYQQVTPRSDAFDGICYMMWCGKSSFGRIITSHPALEGTFCGQNKWCELGRCVPWSQPTYTTPMPAPVAVVTRPAPTTTTTTAAPYIPRRIDGGWSEFSGHNCNACTCNSLVNSVGLSIARRTCSAPYPANGGEDCVGSTARALVCNRACGTKSKTVDEYISEKCAEHKRLKNDQDLTGTGSQLSRYPQRACKVFCDVVNRYGSQRNYRFYGDNLPDGTSCGSDRYCLDGECLSLSCDRNALIGRDLPCPSESCPTEDVTQYWKGQWGTWSLWTSCTVTCGGGYRKRARQCSVKGRCDGSETETDQCGMEPCPELPTSGSNSWTEWTEWNKCSVTCGRGSQARYRKCMTPAKTIAFNCPGEKKSRVLKHGVRRTLHREKNIEVRYCEAGPCDGAGLWAGWGEWSTCSTSCGAGVIVRQRMCAREPCDGSSHERQSCNQATCESGSSSSGTWGVWSAWSDCSRNCGKGVRSRSRSCWTGECNGPTTEQQFCNEQECEPSSEWSSWSAFGPCSVTCGAGVKRRTRYCRSGNCPGSYKESAICNEGECENRNAAWGGWGYWSTCSESCGEGIRKRVRKCYGSGSCGGNEYERQPCFLRACERRRRSRVHYYYYH